MLVRYFQDKTFGKVEVHVFSKGFTLLELAATANERDPFYTDLTVNFNS